MRRACSARSSLMARYQSRLAASRRRKIFCRALGPAQSLIYAAPSGLSSDSSCWAIRALRTSVFETVHAPLGPVGGDDFFNKEGFLGSDGLELVVVSVGEFGEIGFVFTGDDEGFGGSGMLESIETRRGLALGGAGAGGFLRIEPIGGDLCKSSHDSTVSDGHGGASRAKRQEIEMKGNINFKTRLTGFSGLYD